MAIEIKFRGPILYLYEGSTVTGARIPDSERILTDDDGMQDVHPDGMPTLAHYAGLLICEGEKIVHRMSLRGRVVQVVEASGATCSSGAGFDDLLTIDTIANEGREPMTLIPRDDPEFWVRTATDITFQGGTLHGDIESDALFFVKPQTAEDAHPIALGARWVAKDGAAVELIISDPTGGKRPLTIPLNDGETAFIFNWHPAEPTRAALETLPPVADTGQEVEDEDFKWVYELYRPPNGMSFRAWLGGKGVNLPAPVTRYAETVGAAGQVDPPNPGSAGCPGTKGTGGH